MTDKPSDAEIIMLAVESGVSVRTGKGAVKLARAVLAKWGQPAHAAEPVATQWLAEMVMSDCGCSTENQRLLDRIIDRIQQYDRANAAPQPTHAQAGAVPLDEARRLFDAGWKAAALFCDREDVVADGIIGFGACPQFEAAFSAAHGIKGGQHGTE